MNVAGLCREVSHGGKPCPDCPLRRELKMAYSHRKASTRARTCWPFERPRHSWSILKGRLFHAGQGGFCVRLADTGECGSSSAATRNLMKAKRFRLVRFRSFCESCNTEGAEAPT